MVVMFSRRASVPTAKAPFVMESPVKRDEAPVANEHKILKIINAQDFPQNISANSGLVSVVYLIDKRNFVE
jgi:hypothetical protein